MVVCDDVLADPAAYRARVLTRGFSDIVWGDDVFHGIQIAEDETFPAWIVEHFPHLTPTMSFFRQSPRGQREPNYVHTDQSMGEWTAILYLNPDPPLGDGTTFWMHTATGALGSELDDALQRDVWRDLEQFEPVASVIAQMGRALIFPAARFHSRTIAENYGNGDEARLIQVVFGLGTLP